MADRDPDDTNRRFAELIGTEFGSDRAGRLDAPAPADHHTAAPRTPGASQVTPDASSGMDYLDLEFADDVEYRNPSPIRAPQSRVSLLGGILLAFGLLVALAGLFGSRPPAAVTWVAAGCWVVGLAMLMSRALRRPDQDEGPKTRL